MSRKLLTVAALAVFALPLATTTAYAQMGYGVAAGLSAPMGTFGNGVSSGYHLTGLVSFAAPLAPVGFRGEVSFNQFGAKGASNVKANILSGTANAVVSAPGMMGIYGIGGLGLYRNSVSCTGCSSNSTTNVGFNAGAGFKFGLSGFAAFVEARYHHVSTSGGSTAFVPISFGLLF